MAFLYVKIHYGPYATSIADKHTDKIEALKGELLRSGFRVSLIPVEHVNYCMLEMCGHQIFRCNIKDLQLKPEDGLCPALRAVKEASARFLRADNYFWLRSLIEHKIFVPGDYGPKPTWPVQIDFGKKFGLYGPKCPCGCVKL